MGNPENKLAPGKLQAGGTVREGSIYLPRHADEHLFQMLSKGEICHVLAPRQIGKSSLRLRTMRRLEQAGTRAVHVDLTTTVGKDIGPLEWLYAIAWQIHKHVKPSVDFKPIWNEDPDLPPRLRWTRFLKEVLARGIDRPLVVFLEEIDVALALPFPPDDLFSGLRNLWEARSEHPECARVTFCLIGVASADHLMDDARLTPLDISTPIELGDFAREEIEPFAAAFEVDEDTRTAILDRVYDWTAGHPYMTQRICLELLQRGGPEEDVGESIDAIVKEVFLENGRVEDPNLSYANRYLGKDNDEAPVADMLHLYRKLLEGQSAAADLGDAAQIHLQMSGIAGVRREREDPRKDDDTRVMRVRNRIFSHVFDREWVAEREAEWIFHDGLRRWLAAKPEDRIGLVLGPEKLKSFESPGPEELKEIQSLIWSRQGLEYLAASREEARREAEVRAAKADAARARGRVRYLVVLVGLTSVLAMVAVSAVMLRSSALSYAQDEQVKAQQAAELAAIERDRALRRQLVMRTDDALGSGRELDALAWSLQAVDFEGREHEALTSDTVESLGRAVSAASEAFPLTSLGGPAVSLGFTADGGRLFVVTANTASLWDAVTAQPISNSPVWQGSPETAVWGALARDDSAAHVLLRDGRLMRLRLAGGGPETIAPASFRVGFVMATPDGSHLAIAQRLDAPEKEGPSSIRVLDIADKGPPAETLIQAGKVWDMAIAPDGRWLVVTGPDGKLAVWDVHRPGGPVKKHTGTCIAPGPDPLDTDPPSDKDPVIRHGLAMAPDGSHFACFDRARITVWNATTFRPLRDTASGGSKIQAAAFLAERTSLGPRLTLALGRRSGETETRFLMPDAVQEPNSRSLHRGRITRLVAPPQGLRFLSVSSDGTVQRHEAWQSHELLARGGELTLGAFSADGARLATAASDGAVRLWKLGPAWLGHHERGVTGVAVSEDGSVVAAAGLDGPSDPHTAALPGFEVTVKAWAMDATAGTKWPSPSAPRQTIRVDDSSVPFAVSLSPLGSEVAVGGVTVPQTAEPSAARIWDTSNGKLLAELRGHEQGVWETAFTPDGLRVLTMDGAGTARMWTTGGALVFEKPRPSTAPAREASAALSPDGSLFRVLLGGPEAYIRDSETGALRATLSGHRGDIVRARWSKRGSFIVTASRDNTAAIWSVEKCLKDLSCQPLQWLSGAQSSVMDAAVSPDDSLAVTAGDDDVLRLYDRATGKLLAERQHPTIFAAVFSADGSRLVSAGDDYSLRLWAIRPTSDHPVAALTVLPGPARIVNSTFFPDGLHLVTAYADGSVRVDPTTSAGLVKRACRLLEHILDWQEQHAFPRALSGEERASKEDWQRVKAICAEAPRLVER